MSIDRKCFGISSLALGVACLAPSVWGVAAGEPLRLTMGAGGALAFDADRLAVLVPEGLRADARAWSIAAVEAGGVEVVSAEAWAIPGWTVVTVAADDAASDRDEVAGRLEALADAGVWASPVFVGMDGGPVWATPTLLVDGRIELDEAEGVVVDAAFGPGQKVETGARHGLEAVEDAARLSLAHGVTVEPDMVFTGYGAIEPNDPLFSTQWAFDQPSGFDVNGPEAWDITTGDTDVRVLIIDTGVDQNHPDINQLPGFDFTNDGGDGGPVNQFDRHGTPVAGCVSAILNNQTGVVGMAPDCPSISARCFVSVNSGGGWTSFSSWTIAALDLALSDDRIRVTNNSNGYGFTSSIIESRYAQSEQAGVVHFASAGNDGRFGSTYPGSLPTVNTVAASRSSGSLASFSNYGPDIFITAPGDNVRTADNLGSSGYTSSDYAYVFGTSFAAPITAGAAALLISVDPSLSAADVEQALASTATEFSTGGLEAGAGHLDAEAALRSIAPEECLADANMDGILNGADFNAWLTAFAQQRPNADQNQDGVLNGADFNAWLTNFSRGCD